MVARYLKHREYGSQCRSGKIFATVCEYYARYCRGNIGEGDKFPYMSRPDDDYEVR